MSGSHRYYTVTGRALPLPPRRTPSRHSSILRLPTRRAEAEHSTTVRVDSPGRIEVPHGGEFHSIPKSQRAASQMVVYDGAAAARATTKKKAAHVSESPAAAAAPHSRTSSAAHSTRHNTAAAAPRASPSQSASVASAQEYAADNDHHRARNGHRVVQEERENRISGHATPLPPSTAFTADSNSASETSSPCLNRMLPREDSREDMAEAGAAAIGAKQYAEEQQHPQHDDFDAASSDVQSIPMSSTRQSNTPADKQQRPRTTQQQKKADQHSMHEWPSATPHNSDVVPQQQQQQRDIKGSNNHGDLATQHQQPLQRRHTAAATDASSTTIEQRSYRKGPQSDGYSASDVSAPRPAAAAAAAAAVSPVLARSTSATTADSRGRLARHASLSTGNGSTSVAGHVAHADRNDHAYSQGKIDERRASRPANVSTDTSYRPAAGSQHVALVPAPAAVRYSTRSPLSDDDPLEMNTPIANRVRQRSTGATAARSNKVGNGNAASAVVVVGTLEGTELMPSLPRLQGRKADAHHDEEDRTYRTIVRFIEYQPEAERPALEAMLNEFSGREDELCGLLTETYGDDFDMVKAACGRGPSVPLLANSTARALLLTDAPPTHYNARQDSPSTASTAENAVAHSQGDAREGEEDEQQWNGVPQEENFEVYVESSRPYSTPRVEEGDYDEEPVYDEGNYAREMLTPAVPYERY